MKMQGTQNNQNHHEKEGQSPAANWSSHWWLRAAADSAWGWCWVITQKRFGCDWGFQYDKLVEARIVHVWLCDFGLDIVFSRKHKANLPGSFTSLYKAGMLSLVVSADIRRHILKPCSSRNKIQKTVSGGWIGISLSLIIIHKKACPEGTRQPNPGFRGLREWRGSRRVRISA